LHRCRTGAEGRIGHLKRRFGLERFRLEGDEGLQIWTEWAILAYDTDTLAAPAPLEHPGPLTPLSDKPITYGRPRDTMARAFRFLTSCLRQVVSDRVSRTPRPRGAARRYSERTDRQQLSSDAVPGAQIILSLARSEALGRNLL
jgi:IS5 family transposase